MINRRIKSLAEFCKLYPMLFSQKRMDEWRAMFDDRAVMARAEEGTNTWVIAIDEAMDEQRQYAEENTTFEEQWNNIRVNEYANIATVVADYTLTADKEVRRGIDVVTLLRDSEGWRVVSLVYEQLDISEG